MRDMRGNVGVETRRRGRAEIPVMPTWVFSVAIMPMAASRRPS